MQFHCCTSNDLDPEVKQVLKEVQAVPFAVAQLIHVQEVSLCNYSLIVCTPLLCDASDSASEAASGA